MNRSLALPLLFVTCGCSTCPQAGLMDRLFPSRCGCTTQVCEAPMAVPVYSSPMPVTVAPAPMVAAPTVVPMEAPPPMMVTQGVMTEVPTTAAPAEHRKKCDLFGWFRRNRTN